MKCAILVNQKIYDRVFDEQTVADLSGNVQVVWNPCEEVTEKAARQLISGADTAITSWETPMLEKWILDAAPRLKLIAHAAGSVKPIVSNEVIARGIQVTSAAAAIAPGVAEFCLAAMVMSGKRLREQISNVAAGGWTWDVPGQAMELFRARVGIIGTGHVGRHLIRLLKCFELKSIWVYDPYLPDAGAAEFGVEKRELEEIFSQCDFISLNAPSTPQTEGMISRDFLQRIKPNAVFINTARGAVVDESALIDELKTGRFLAFLDVTEPEPAAEDNPLRNLPNVILTPHIAGAVAQNARRNGMYAAREVVNFIEGRPLMFPIDLTSLGSIA